MKPLVQKTKLQNRASNRRVMLQYKEIKAKENLSKPWRILKCEEHVLYAMVELRE